MLVTLSGTLPRGKGTLINTGHTVAKDRNGVKTRYKCNSKSGYFLT